MMTLTCVQCGKQFERAAGEVNRKRKPKTGPFCSRACHTRWRSTGKKLTPEHRRKLMGRTAWNKGRPWPKSMRKKLSVLASDGSRARERNGHWKGGVMLTRDRKGRLYRKIRIKGKYRLEHDLVMESHIGRKLRKGEVVHHVNENTLDNRLENLRLMLVGEHMRLHNTGDRNHRRKAKRARAAAS